MPKLLPLIPEHVSYVEVFGGAAALLLNKPPSPIEVLNDLDGELVNLFEVIRDDADAFLRRADFLLYSRELHARWCADLKNRNPPLDRVERAVRFWYVIRSSFSGGHGWAFTRRAIRCIPETMQNALANIRAIHERLKAVEIDHLDFRACIKNRDAPTTFMFLDPPYLDTHRYSVGDFGAEDHRELAQVLHDVKAKWLMTVGNHPRIRELYADFPQTSITSSMNVRKVARRSKGSLKHLLIRNYDPPKQPLYTCAASQLPLMDLFGLEIPTERRATLPLQAL